MSHYLSLKFFSSLKKKSFLSFFIYLSAIGTIIGVFALTIIISFLNTAQSAIIKSYLENEPHIKILPKSGIFLKEDLKFYESLKKSNEILKIRKNLSIDGFSREYKGKINGYDDIKKVVIPFGIAGNKYCFSVSELNLTPFGPSLKRICLQKEEEGKRIEAPLELLQKQLGKENKISEYQIFLRDYKKVNDFLREIKKNLPQELKFQTVNEEKAPVFYALKLEKVSLVLAVFLILLVSFLQLYYSLKLLFHHYKTTWAVLKILGLEEKEIKGIFKNLTFYILFFSFILGSIFAFLFIIIQNKYHFFPFPSDLYHFKYLKYKIPYFELTFLLFSIFFISWGFGNSIGKEMKKLNLQEVLRVQQ